MELQPCNLPDYATVKPVYITIRMSKATNFRKRTESSVLLRTNKKFWEELIAYFPLITRTAYRKMPRKMFRCRGNVLTELLPSNDRSKHRQTHRHTSNDTSIVGYIYCRWNVFFEPLPSHKGRDTYRHTNWRERFMKYAFEMSSCAIILWRIYAKNEL
jgi:hypothetical protein